MMKSLKTSQYVIKYSSSLRLIETDSMIDMEWGLESGTTKKKFHFQNEQSDTIMAVTEDGKVNCKFVYGWNKECEIGNRARSWVL